MLPLAFLPVAMATATLLASSVASSRVWTVESFGCIADSLAVSCHRNVRSDGDCLQKAADTTGDLLAQLRPDGGSCCVFRYDSVSHLLAEAAALSCRLFSDNSMVPESVRLMKDRLEGLWRLRRDGSSGFENIAGRTIVHEFFQHNVAWSSDGATFNGVDSFMLLNSTAVMSVSVTGFTVGVRVRRTPRVQPFVDFRKFNNINSLGPHIMEYSEANRLHLNPMGQLLPSAYINTATNTLPNDASAWVNIAISGDAATGAIDLFVGDAFVSRSLWSRTNQTSSQGPLTLMLGHRIGTGSSLLGTLKGAVLARARLNENELRDIFKVMT